MKPLSESRINESYYLSKTEKSIRVGQKKAKGSGRGSEGVLVIDLERLGLGLFQVEGAEPG